MEPEAREVIRAWYASITFTNYNVSRVLDALERLKLRDKTIIMFWGDHGYHLGEKGKWSKHNSLFEVGTRVPMMIVMPGAKGNGNASPRVVEAVDLYATLTDFCGLPIPNHVEGASIKSLLTNPNAKWDRPALTTHEFNNHAVRSADWRYICYNGGGEELYDETKDPYEWTNLAGDKKYNKVKAELSKHLPKTNKPRGAQAKGEPEDK